MANLTFEQLQNIFTQLTFKIKNLDYNSKDQNVQKLVRRAYLQESQPFNNITDDTTYFWLTVKDDPTNELYNERKEIVNVYDEDGNIIDRLTKHITTQTRDIEVTFIFYGDKAFDSSQESRMKLTSLEIYDFLKAYNIYLKREINGVVYTYEEYQNRWWKRADFSATFSTSIILEEIVDTIKQVDIDITDGNNTETIVIKED